jgi:hypothetical protein
MDTSNYQLGRTEDGSLGKGFALAFLCQFGYLLFIYGLNWQAAQGLGYKLFALVQFFYLFPLAVFCKKRNQARTANGLIVTGAISLFGAVVWFGYAAIHGALPPILQG